MTTIFLQRTLLIQTLIFILMLTTVSSHRPLMHDDSAHECAHGKFKSKIDVIDIPYDTDDAEGRNLQSFQSLRIYIDYTKISNAAPDYKAYLSDVIVPPVTNYWGAALKVAPMNGNLKSPGLTTMCDGAINVPDMYLNDGVNADLVMFVDLINDISLTYIAYAIPCALNSLDKRAVFGKITFNAARFSPSKNSVQIERDILVALHETTHVLGFSSMHYSNYIDPITKTPLQGHLFTKTVNGAQVTVLNVAPLTTRLRNYFNCPTLEGAYLENEGSVGSVGQHFERRIFFNEVMTPSVLKDAKVTEFTLALLEGTGWYQVDYTLAESITWGKNKGCSFLDSPCMDKTTTKPNFEEFCSTLTGLGVSWTKRGGSVCATSKPRTDLNLNTNVDYWNNKTAVNDGFADNCPIYSIFGNMDCEDEDIQLKSTLPTSEFYGYGSKCFRGNLAPLGKVYSPFFYCFKPICELQSTGGYSLKVVVGTQTVTCVSMSSVSVPGLSGSLFCPDVNNFCNQITSEGGCRRGCFGRGACINKVCQCNDGWGGPDCSKQIYIDNCQRCKGGDPLRTSCFGDSCACNPSTNTCARLLAFSNIFSIEGKDENISSETNAQSTLHQDNSEEPNYRENLKYLDGGSFGDHSNLPIMYNQRNSLDSKRLFLSIITIIGMVAAGAYLVLRYRNRTKSSKFISVTSAIGNKHSEYTF